jgi:hypothetical protein
MGQLFESARYFKVWTYAVSHRRLLLRSTKEGGLPSRIDVYLSGIDRMLLRPYYDGLRVAEADAQDLGGYRDRYGEVAAGYKLFTLEPDLGSFVVAGNLQWHEDAGSYRDPSYFGHFLGA